MTECIFCKIINKEIPCFELYDDDLVKAFLVKEPTANGHLIIISKEHYTNIFDTPDDVLGRINQVCKKMALLCKEKLGATGVNILNAAGIDAQRSVDHIHYHIVPRFKDDGLDLWLHGKTKNIDYIETTYQKFIS